jgi:dTDP-glucose pyrophosphorylase
MRKVNLIPMAGAGQRFIDEGYTIPKPMIDINGLPMIIKAAKCLPNADMWIFICKKEHIKSDQINKTLKKNFPNSTIISIDYLTEGQASTCLLAKELLKPNDILTIGACDAGMVYNKNDFNNKIINNDALIWTFKNNKSVMKNPNAYGYVDINNNGSATRVSCKNPISHNPINDHAIVGTFTFKRAEHFLVNAELVIKKDLRVNNEFYLDVVLDECINNGLKIAPLQIKTYFCWGTPSDLSDFLKR